MDTGLVLNTLRDPAGIPAHPAVFQTLMVLTWVLHIAFVHLSLGSAALALYTFLRRRETYYRRLSIALTKVAKVGISLLIVLGVAPLLFTQVIYDPLWYVSNLLSARWAIAFIFTLIIGYCLWFAFYSANRPGAGRLIGLYAALALALLLLDGVIMHALAYQALLPGQWLDWYAPAGVVDMSGARLHAVQPARLLFLLSLALPAVGLFLLGYADYFHRRGDYEPQYLAFVRVLGRRLALPGLLISLALLLWWQFDHPAGSGLATHPGGWAVALALVLLIQAVVYLEPEGHGYALLAGGCGLLAVLAVWREMVRIAYLSPFGYRISDYRVHLDWPSLLLFFTTLAGIGGLVGGFYVALLYRAGRVKGLYAAEPAIARLGTAAVVVLGIWITLFFAYGITIWVRNVFLDY